MAIGQMLEYLTTSEVAEILGVTTGRVRQLKGRGDLRAILFGNQCVFLRNEIEEYAKRIRPTGRPRTRAEKKYRR